MMRTILLFLLTLWYASHIHDVEGCDQDKSLDCNFQQYNHGHLEFTLCNWATDGGFTGAYIQPTNIQWFARLKYYKDEGRLTSLQACSTKRQTRCLHFQYSFDVNDAIDMSVSISDDGYEGTEQLLWTASTGTGQTYHAKIPVTTNSSVAFVIKAKRRSNKQERTSFVAIDNIRYVKSPCTELLPVSPSPLPLAIPSTTRVLSPRMAATSSYTTSSYTTAVLSSSIAATSFYSTTDFGDSITESDDSFNYVGVIIGVVVAVICVIIVTATSIALLRRRQPSFCRTCFDDRQREETVQNAQIEVSKVITPEAVGS
ncbi:uncharacterized protein [Littorina saxatilis]|uniref:uncharacterized protein n=1 Tax=Littorina saxatilis TaxID=31220 RepID=UPI0038B59842